MYDDYDDFEDEFMDFDEAADICRNCGNYGTMEDGLCELCFADQQELMEEVE